jgi:hypothetical protein
MTGHRFRPSGSAVAMPADGSEKDNRFHPNDPALRAELGPCHELPGELFARPAVRNRKAGREHR